MPSLQYQEIGKNLFPNVVILKDLQFSCFFDSLLEIGPETIGLRCSPLRAQRFTFWTLLLTFLHLTLDFTLFHRLLSYSFHWFLSLPHTVFLKIILYPKVPVTWQNYEKTSIFTLIIKSTSLFSFTFCRTFFTYSRNTLSSIATNTDEFPFHITLMWPQSENASEILSSNFAFVDLIWFLTAQWWVNFYLP